MNRMKKADGLVNSPSGYYYVVYSNTDNNTGHIRSGKSYNCLSIKTGRTYTFAFILKSPAAVFKGFIVNLGVQV